MRRGPGRSLAAVAALFGAAAAFAAPCDPASVHPIRGITVSCWGWGAEWASPGMRELMATLPSQGAGWIAIHPYAHVSRETGEIRFRRDRPPRHVTQPIRWARELGLKIMVTPHVSYWGEFSWRGDVGWPDGDRRWARFQESYRDWIVDVARLCEEEGADLLVVGSELRRTEPMRAFWAGVIADVRRTYRGPLTYASNWDDFERVPFWDLLDYVGVQAYFPLSASEAPSLEELRRGWESPVRRMTAVAERTGKPVILTELGYTDSARAAIEPWKENAGPSTTRTQALCLQAALEVVERTPAVAGAFLWKWFPTTDAQGPDDFTVQTPGMKAIIAEVWRPSRGAPPAATGR